MASNNSISFLSTGSSELGSKKSESRRSSAGDKIEKSKLNSGNKKAAQLFEVEKYSEGAEKGM